jgi:hypothetical protein
MFNVIDQSRSINHPFFENLWHHIYFIEDEPSVPLSTQNKKVQGLFIYCALLQETSVSHIMSSRNHENRSISCLTKLTKLVFFGTLIGVYIIADVSAFTPPVSKSSTAVIGNSFLNKQTASTTKTNRIMPIGDSSTSLNALLEVPEYFFTLTFPMLGILLSVSKGFARLRLEESAWEQRLEEAREKRLREDPTLTELELRSKEASVEWSAYGKPRKQEAERERAMRDGDEGNFSRSSKAMDDDEINQFEMEYGIEYDPYYDDPYAEDELPDDVKFRLDKKYGDRIYENGEIFYKDKSSGMFYRQGAKPRNLSFW